MANIMRLGGGGGKKYMWNKYEVVPLLPEQYTPVEYIESAGSARIDTGVVPNSDVIRVEMDNVQLTGALSTQSWFMQINRANTSGVATAFQVGVLSSKFTMHLVNVATAGDTPATSYPTNLVLTLNANLATLSGDATGTITNNSIQTGSYRSGGISLFEASCRMGDVRVHKAGAMVRNLIPCVHSSGTTGMYDVVAGEFLQSAVAAAFSAGKEVERLVVGELVDKVSANTIDAFPNGGVLDGYYYEAVGEEISITENGTYDVRPYTTANVDVVSAPVLLWTNASPTSAFAAQYLSVPQYDTIIVESAFNINNGARKTITVLEFSKGINRIVCENGSTQYALRDVSYSGNSLYIGNGLSGSTVNNLCIPLRIWGANFAL